MGFFSRKNGFTLIELLVVVLIIGVLSAIALPQYQIAVGKTRTTEAMIALRAITEAQEAYYMAAGQYATSLDQLDITVGPSGKYYNFSCSSGRTCFATPRVANSLPNLEFHMQIATHSAVTQYLGKHWCQVASNYTEVNLAICKSLGEEDPTMPTGKYFVIR